MIKQLNIQLENNRVKIVQLEVLIKQGHEVNEINKKKMEELLINNSNKEEKEDNSYEELLLQQIKDKNQEIGDLKKDINTKETDNESIIKKYNTLKNQLKGLFNN